MVDVHLGSIDFDGTADGDGVIWTVRRDGLNGVFGGPDIERHVLNTSAAGEISTAAYKRGRTIELHATAKGSGANWAYNARQTLRTVLEAAISSTITLTVDEPTGNIDFAVYLAGGYEVDATEAQSALDIMIPLRCDDPDPS